MLSTRAAIYVNRKGRKLDDALKKELLSVITKPQQLPSITISGQIISDSEKYNDKILYFLLSI